MTIQANQIGRILE